VATADPATVTPEELGAAMTGAGDADPGAGPDDAGTPDRVPAPPTPADGPGEASKGGAP